MATRAEDYKADQLSKHTSKRVEKKKAKAKTAKASVAKAKKDHVERETHNQAKRAKPGSAYELEKGTRKSTRIAKNRAKTDSSLRKTETVKSRSPEARAARKKEGGRAKR